MFKRIIVPYDGLKTTIHSVCYSMQVAKIFGSKVYIVHIIDKDSFNSAKLATKLSDSMLKKYCLLRTNGIFNEVTEEFRKNNFENFELKIEFSESVDLGIKKFTQKNKIDLCIVEQSPYASSEMVGNLASKISKKINIPTIFIKTKNSISKKARILFTIDEKERNFAEILGIAKELDAKAIFYHTTWKRKDLPLENPASHCEEKVKLNLKKIETELKNEFETIIEMEPTIEGGIMKCAVKKGVDLIVMHQSKSVLGGKPDLVLTHSMYPVLLLP